MPGTRGRHHNDSTPSPSRLTVEPRGGASRAGPPNDLRVGKARLAVLAASYFRRLTVLFEKIDHDAVARLAEVILEARERGATTFVFGNGGSAATASHFANDIGIGTRTWDRPFRILSLSDNAAVLTAIANDYGYDVVFSRQLATQMQPGDVVIALSASGNSPNVLEAVKYANVHGAVTVGLTGFDGGQLRRIAQLGVHVATAKGEYGPVEDVHMVLGHVLTASLLAACQPVAEAQA